MVLGSRGVRAGLRQVGILPEYAISYDFLALTSAYALVKSKGRLLAFSSGQLEPRQRGGGTTPLPPL